MLEILILAGLLYLAFYLLKTIPDAKEEHLQDSQTTISDAKESAELRDYEHLYNETNF